MRVTMTVKGVRGSLVVNVKNRWGKISGAEETDGVKDAL